jgi:hypothetical protein
MGLTGSPVVDGFVYAIIVQCYVLSGFLAYFIVKDRRKFRAWRAEDECRRAEHERWMAEMDRRQAEREATQSGASPEEPSAG